jgi:hypothetical protein
MARRAGTVFAPVSRVDPGVGSAGTYAAHRRIFDAHPGAKVEHPVLVRIDQV